MVLVSELYIVASTISAIFNLLFITIAVIGYWRKKNATTIFTLRDGTRIALPNYPKYKVHFGRRGVR